MRRELAAEHGQPVLSLTLNIPGADKNPAGSAQAFDSLRQALGRAIARHCGHTACFAAETERAGVDGPCWIAAVNLDPAQLKALCVAVEEDHPLGRLADADVLNALGLKASAVGNHEFDQGYDDLTGRVIGTDGKRNEARW